MRFCSQKLMQLWKHVLAQKLDFTFPRIDLVLNFGEIFKHLGQEL